MINNMKSSSQFLFSLVLVLLFSIVALATNDFNITSGSSISTTTSTTNTSSYWLSPSGNMAFGFYPLCSNSSSSFRFVVGIWFVKSADKTLVWMANPTDSPLHHPSSLLFNNDGKLILRTRDIDGGKDKPLLPLVSTEPASYAAMLDNGNFILYGFNSTIIWESFDYPTNTILGGQTLKSEQSLISSFSSKFDPSMNKNYELKIIRDYVVDFLLCDLDRKRMYDYPSYCDPQVNKTEKVRPITMKLDSITGRLYIVDNWDLVVKNFTGEDKPQPQQEEQEVVLYRATLDVDGSLRLYKEMIGIEGEKSMVVWQWPEVYKESAFDKFTSSTKGIIIIVVTVCLCFGAGFGCWVYFDSKRISDSDWEKAKKEDGR